MKTLIPLFLFSILLSATPSRQAAPTVKGLLNMSLRAEVPTNGQIIAGFVLDQNGTVIIRAAGPALAQFGVASAMSNPTLQIWQNGRVIQDNDDWDPSASQAAAMVGAFPFTPGSKDAAIVANLAAGAYTAVVKDSVASTNKTGREVLIEVYNATITP